MKTRTHFGSLLFWGCIMVALAAITLLFPDPAPAIKFNEGYDPGAVRRSGSNAADPFSLPGSLRVAGNASVTGALSVAGTTELNGTASAVKVLGCPTQTGGRGTNGFAGLDVWSGGNAILAGGDNGANTRTNSTTKILRFAYPHFTNNEEPIAFGMGYCDNAESWITLGGSSSTLNSPMSIRFRTAGSLGTTTGVEAGRITSSQEWLIATSTDNGAFDLQVASAGWFGGEVSALGFVDRTAAPESLADAYEIVQSHESLGGKLDHSKLSPLAWGSRTVERKTGRKITKTVEVDEPIPAEEIPAAEEGKPAPETTRKAQKQIEEDEIERITEPDQSGRNLSMVVSAQAMVIKDLMRRLEALEKH